MPKRRVRETPEPYEKGPFSDLIPPASLKLLI